jgi:RNA polymerase sigma-70 factor, ECF subfamily
VQETIREVRRNFDPCRATNEKAFLRWLRQVLLATLAKRMRCGLETQRLVAWLENTLTQRLENSSPMLDQGLFKRHDAPGQRTVPREPVVLLADVLEQLPDAYREVRASGQNLRPSSVRRG